MIGKAAGGVVGTAALTTPSKQVREEEGEGDYVLTVVVDDRDERSWVVGFEVRLVVLGDRFASEVFFALDPEDSSFNGL
jgi:hypothetical protein